MGVRAGSNAADAESPGASDGGSVGAVRAALAQAGLAAGERVLVMLSGGRDSTCLLDAAVGQLGAGPVTALHVNYGLRAEADADQRCCEALCDQLGVQLHCELAGTPPDSGNFQAWAREARYRVAGERAGGASILVAHTATDQAETILYRLASSPSRRALYGMRAREGQLRRPLLRITREQTTAYCDERGLDYCDDVTNDSDRYARNRVRQTLLPALQAIHPGALGNLLTVAELLRDEGEVLDRLVDAELAGGDTITLQRLAELEPALARLIVQRLADQAAAGTAPGAGRRLEDLLALARDGSAQLDLPHGVRATANDGLLRFGLTPDFPGRRNPAPTPEPGGRHGGGATA